MIYETPDMEVIELENQNIVITSIKPGGSIDDDTSFGGFF